MLLINSSIIFFCGEGRGELVIMTFGLVHPSFKADFLWILNLNLILTCNIAHSYVLYLIGVINLSGLTSTFFLYCS